MLLTAGTKLGSFEVLSLLGSGGMGEVYRARDTKLGRDVALKVLPEALAKDASRMTRLHREAQLLASLNHPNIATIFGLEECNGVSALAMELVEGPTLAERIAGVTVGGALASPDGSGSPRRVPMPLDEASPILKQLADGLEYAHERGIIHRDLKPANVKVRPDGAVKILDFGLAKALEGTPAAGSISDSPTISAAATREGIILGTTAYMSPEQARGKTVGRRSDIWSFGAVLFEVLSGKQAFPGEDVSHTLAAVIMKEPDWEALPATTPASLQRLLRRCLNKDPKQRLRDIGEARIAIEETLSGPEIAPPLFPPLSEEGKREARGGGPWRRTLPWALAAVSTLLLLALIVRNVLRAPGPRTRPVKHLIVNLPATVRLAPGFTPVLAFSPDGRWLAYGSDESGRPEIYVRPFPGPGGKTQISTDGGVQPVWARNGRELFYRNGDSMMASVIEAKPVFSAARPKLLFDGHYEAGTFPFEPNYDVSPDGKRFLMVRGSDQESAATPMNVLLDWSDELRRLVPTGRR